LSLKLVKTFNFLDEIVLEPVIRTKRENPMQMETAIDQAYISAILGDSFMLTAGKYLNTGGSGFFVNPSDLLNEDKDLFDPLYQREGKILTQIGWSHGLNSAILGYMPKRDRETEDGTAFAKFSTEISGAKTYLTYAYNKDDLSTFGLNISRFFGERIEFHLDSRFQLRQRTPEIHRERSHSVKYGQYSSSGYYLFGSRVVLTPQKTFIVEGIFQESGLKKNEIASYLRKEEADRETINPSQQSRIIGQRYAFVAYRDESFIHRTRIHLSALYNIEDQSSYASVEAKYTFSPIINISFTPTFNMGKRYTEFGEAFASAIYYVSLSGMF
jgi:hypothetical protein